MKKIFEKIYPLIGAVVVQDIGWKYEINCIDSENLSEALNGDITIA